MKKLAFSSFILFFSLFVFTQENNSLVSKSINEKEKVDSNFHSVKKAVLFSTIVPGSGQIYNHFAMPKGSKKAFWKVPLIYAGLGTTGYFLLKNNSLKNELKKEYNDRNNGNDGLEKYAEYDLYGIESLYNVHLNRRDLLIVGFSLVYLLQIVEAAVEAHFVTFDITNDLSIDFNPVLYSFNEVGFKLSLNFVK